MKLMSLPLTALLVTTSLSCYAQDNSWKSDYGIPAECNNPVFTKPTRTVPGGRVEGAGINMNDGQAYQDHFVRLSSEWHYAPKLPVSEAEVPAITKVIAKRAAGDGNLGLKNRVEEMPKICVKRIHGCNALVIYRVLDYEREAEQYLVSYDASGKMVDYMSLGYLTQIDQAFQAEPHGQYKASGHWEESNVEIDKEKPHCFVVKMRNHYKDMNDKGVDWTMNRHYSIDAKGLITLVKVDENNAPAINAVARELMEMRLTPMSRFSDLMTRLHKVQPKVGNNEEFREAFNEMLEHLYAYDPQRFLTWVYTCPKCDLTHEVKSRLESSSSEGEPLHRNFIREDVKAITSVKARNYWQRMVSKWLATD